MGYLATPDKCICPLPLLLARQRGDSRMLVDGGVLDQPVIWLACNVAAGIEYRWDEWRKPDFNIGEWLVKYPDDEDAYNSYLDLTMERSAFNA